MREIIAAPKFFRVTAYQFDGTLDSALSIGRMISPIDSEPNHDSITEECTLHVSNSKKEGILSQGDYLITYPVGGFEILPSGKFLDLYKVEADFETPSDEEWRPVRLARYMNNKPYLPIDGYEGVPLLYLISTREGWDDGFQFEIANQADDAGLGPLMYNDEARELVDNLVRRNQFEDLILWASQHDVYAVRPLKNEQ